MSTYSVNSEPSGKVGKILLSISYILGSRKAINFNLDIKMFLFNGKNLMLNKRQDTRAAADNLDNIMN